MGLPPLIKALLKQFARHDKPKSIKLIQTHISYILLTPQFVYKIKKPVNFGFLDFSSIQKRRYYCAEEVRLNRRLSKGVYLDIVPISKSSRRYSIEDKRTQAEYAVKMRRISDETFLANKIKDGTIGEAVIKKIARRIAQFHRSAISDRQIEKFGTPAAIARNTTENFSQSRPFIGKTISRPRYDFLQSYTNDFLSSHRTDLIKRIKGGFIRDCHGDIHADHVAIDNSGTINIIDCIEFSERYRCSDTALDAAFLSMNLDYLGRPDLARLFEDAYFNYARDDTGRALMPFYKSYRAFVRGKVATFKSTEPEVTSIDRACAGIDAMRHFCLASQYAGGGMRPLFIIMRGLSGSGKSTYAKAIADAFDMTLISSDAVRKKLVGINPAQHAYAQFGKGIYSPAMNQKTYDAMNSIAAGLLKKGVPVLIDATFLKLKDVHTAKKGATAANANFHVIQCYAGEAATKKRICKRKGDPSNISDALWDVYLEQKKLFEPAWHGAIRLNTEEGLAKNLIKAARSVFY